MPYLLTTDWVLDHYSERLAPLLQRLSLTPLLLPGGDQRLPTATLESIAIAFFHGDFRSDPEYTRRFFGTCLRAPNLAWMQLPNSGVDDPVFARLQQKGVRLTNAPGAAAEPIAQTAITAMLMLARGFPRWLAAQARRSWDPHPWATAPADLGGQTVVIVGLGAIGGRIAVLAKAFGLHVIGIRRQPGAAPAGVDEVHAPAALPEIARGADWLVLACPLNEATRGLVSAELIGQLKASAAIINVSRGEIVDEAALVDALRQGRLAGAYLDVFEHEPLAPESPLWTLPNVLVSPHDSAAARGNAHRVSELFLRNLGHWAGSEPLEHEVG